MLVRSVKGYFGDLKQKSLFLDFLGWLAIAVPGELHGMWTEYINFGGRIPWANLVQPTIELLQEGVRAKDRKFLTSTSNSFVRELNKFTNRFLNALFSMSNNIKILICIHIMQLYTVHYYFGS